MTKVDELIILIENEHQEWKSLNRRQLRDASSYSESTCGRALKKINEQVIEPKKKKVQNNNKSGGVHSSPSHGSILPKFEGDEIDFAKQAFIKGIEAGNYNLVSGWVQFLDKTGKLQDYKTNREEELQETFKYMSPRELVMEAIGVQNEVRRSVKTLLKDTSQEQDS